MKLRLIMGACLAALTMSGCAHKMGRAANGPELEMDSTLVATIRAGGNNAAAARQELAYQLLNDSDVACEDYLIGVSVQRNTVSSALDVTGLILSTAATLATGGQTAQILSGFSAVTQGSKTTLENTIFEGNNYPLLYSAVKRGRRDDRAEIEADIDVGKFNTWAPEQIRKAILPYHLNCGINYAITQIDDALNE